ncbi:hypothetical protein D3C77_232480 [compost metagenome]
MQALGGTVEHAQVTKAMHRKLTNVAVRRSSSDQIADLATLDQRQWIEGHLTDLVVVRRVILAAQLVLLKQGMLQGLQNRIRDFRGLHVHVRSDAGDFIQPTCCLVGAGQVFKLLPGMTETRIEHLEHAAGQQRSNGFLDQCQAQRLIDTDAAQFNAGIGRPVPAIGNALVIAFQRKNQ